MGAIMSKDPAVLFYTNDFLSRTFTMTDEQVGKYIRLLCIQHQQGVLTEQDMLNICKTYDSSVYSKFIKDGDTYYNKRMKEEATKRANYSESRRNNQKGNKGKHISNTYDKHMEDEDVNEDINKDSIKKLWIKTFGRNPSIPEQDETQKLIDKFGYEKTYKIMYKANLDGFKKIKTLVEALDDKGNIKEKESPWKKTEGTGRVIKPDNQEFKKILEEANKQPKWKPK